MSLNAGQIKPYPAKSLLRETVTLLLVALVLAGLSWALRPPRLPLRADTALYDLDLDFPVATPAEAVAMYDGNTHLLVDTRAVARDGLRIPGAFHIRQDSFEDDLLEVFDFMAPEDSLLLFGDGNLILISAIASRLEERGYLNITIMTGGLDQWTASGGETAEARHD
jgi:rhodanese-related sulfurtransferase